MLWITFPSDWPDPVTSGRGRDLEVALALSVRGASMSRPGEKHTKQLSPLQATLHLHTQREKQLKPAATDHLQYITLHDGRAWDNHIYGFKNKRRHLTSKYVFYQKKNSKRPDNLKLWTQTKTNSIKPLRLLLIIITDI